MKNKKVEEQTLEAVHIPIFNGGSIEIKFKRRKTTYSQILDPYFDWYGEIKLTGFVFPLIQTSFKFPLPGKDGVSWMIEALDRVRFQMHLNDDVENPFGELSVTYKNGTKNAY